MKQSISTKQQLTEKTKQNKQTNEQTEKQAQKQHVKRTGEERGRRIATASSAQKGSVLLFATVNKNPHWQGVKRA